MNSTKKSMMYKKRNLKEGEMIPLYFDEAFKMMYANPKYIRTLTLLISKILNVHYEKIEGKVELVPTTVPSDTLGEVKSERDIVVSLKTNPAKKIILEMNIRRKFYQYVIDRNLEYLKQVASRGLEEGKNYEDMRITLEVNFNDFFVDADFPKAFDLYRLRNERGHILSGKIEVLNINIAECYKLWYTKAYKGMFGPDEEDLVLLCAAMYTEKREEFDLCIESVRTYPEIKKEMKGAVSIMTEDERMWGRLYNKEEEEKRIWEGIRQEERENAKKEGIKQGIEQGIEQGIASLVKNMYNNHMTVEEISKIANMSEGKIREILE